MKHLFLFGFGVTGQTIARQAATQYSITAFAKTPQTIAKIHDAGFGFGLPKNYDYLVMSAPPRMEDPYIPQAVPCKAMVYLSTTAVYGDHQGAWVDEKTLPNPLSERAHARLKAEESWQRFADKHQFPLTIFRLSGIYGASRNPFHALKDGTARRIVKENQFFNRIHEEDVARACLTFLQKEHAGIVNGADDLPAPSHEVISYAATLLNLSPPPLESFETAQLTGMARSFWAENKRISNEKLKKLGGALTYPTYKEGLLNCLNNLKSSQYKQPTD